MKKSVMEKWTKELESGRYRQVDGALKKPRSNKAYGYCCLGVLCDIYARETGKGEWATNFLGEKAFVTKEVSETGTLPEPVRKWAGLKSESGEVDGKPLLTKKSDFGDDDFCSLISLNDDAGLKFPEISKVIRKNYKRL